MRLRAKATSYTDRTRARNFRSISTAKFGASSSTCLRTNYGAPVNFAAKRTKVGISISTVQSNVVVSPVLDSAVIVQRTRK